MQWQSNTRSLLCNHDTRWEHYNKPDGFKYQENGNIIYIFGNWNIFDFEQQFIYNYEVLALTYIWMNIMIKTRQKK